MSDRVQNAENIILRIGIHILKISQCEKICEISHCEKTKMWKISHCEIVKFQNLVCFAMWNFTLSVVFSQCEIVWFYLKNTTLLFPKKDIFSYS